MSQPRTHALALLAALLLTAVLAPVEPAAPAAAPGFSEVTDVVAVEVPVQVLRDGEPVRGLTADDFEVYEGRQKQAITGFEVLDLAAPMIPGVGAASAGRPRSLPPAARRHFLLLFDLSSAAPKSLVKAQEAARDLVGSLQPSDLLAVAAYGTTRGLQLVLGFTSDRRQVAAALDRLASPEMFGRAADPLRLMLDSSHAGFNPGSERSASFVNIGKENDAALLNEHLASLTTQLERGTFEQKGADVLALTRSFTGFAHMMAGIQGRKYVVYLSEGFDSSLLFGSTDPADVDRMSEASTSGQIWNVDSGLRYGSTRAGHELERMLEELRRADCVIQAVDVGGVRAEPGNRAAKGQDSLFLLADGTGGDLYRNFNDLSAVMGEVLKRTSVTYVLTFQPEGLLRDGSYHKLRVELKDASRGARVVHRAGFYAPRPYAEQSPLEKLLAAGRQVMSGVESGSMRAAVLAAPFQVAAAAGPASREAYVPVLVEVDGADLLAGVPAGSELPAEIYAYAVDPAGAVRGFVSQTVGLDLAKVAPALRQSGLKFFGHMDLPPGEYTLRVLVRNGATGASALRVVPLVVPEPGAAAGPVLLPPFFPEPQGKWLIVREAPRPGDRQVPYPFMLGEEPYVPASLPVLRAGQEVRMSLVGYNLGAGQVRLESRILTSDGRDLGPGELRLLEREAADPDRPDRLLAAFRPDRLQPGEYLLLVTLTDGRGKAESSSTPFVIRNGQG
jgi:VWFA-related protein